ncbi:hypothetical protein DITRI_Ditri02bG0086500 [Diplodiscus trichospermus]
MEHSSNSPVLYDKKEKKRWSFAKSSKDANSASQFTSSIARNIPAIDVAWLRCYIADTEKEQNEHAIVVAAITAVAADAVVAATQAVVAVVRLTSNGRGTLFGGGRERWATVKIQTIFRGYLARKTLRAFKGLVRLQALIRGYLVRKRAAATLHSMQALIRAQTAVRSHWRRHSFCNKENRYYPENMDRKSIPKNIEIDTFKTRSRSCRYTIAASECGVDDLPYQTISLPLPCPVPARASVPSCQNLHDFEWCFTGDEYRFYTAQSTPRFAKTVRSNAPITPVKSGPETTILGHIQTSLTIWQTHNLSRQS